MLSVENVALLVAVPLVGEGRGSEYLKTAQIFNQHDLIKILIWKYYPILQRQLK